MFQFTASARKKGLKNIPVDVALFTFIAWEVGNHQGLTDEANH